MGKAGWEMPRFKPMARLERTALADLWKHTLSRIPTISGRLVYLASLRDPASGTYRHHGLITSFGRDEAVRALRESHEKEFQAWLTLSLKEKDGDLRQYFLSLEPAPEQVADHWLQSGIYRSYTPAAALPVEIELFCKDLETLLGFVRHDGITRRQHSAAEPRYQDSSPPE